MSQFSQFIFFDPPTGSSKVCVGYVLKVKLKYIAHSPTTLKLDSRKNVRKSRAVMDLELDFYLKCKVFWQFGWRIVSQETFTQSFSFSFCNHTASTRRNRHGTSSSEDLQLYFRRRRKKRELIKLGQIFQK